MNKTNFWTKEEDKILVQVVEETLEKQNELENFQKTFNLPKKFPWKKVSDRITTRNSKQCWERYLNHLKPGINPLPWTEEEDEVLLLLAKKYPSQWQLLSEIIQGRTANAVKLRWRYHERRKLKGCWKGQLLFKCKNHIKHC